MLALLLAGALPAHGDTLEGTAGVGVELPLLPSEGTLEGTAGVAVELPPLPSEGTLDGTAGVGVELPPLPPDIGTPDGGVLTARYGLRIGQADSGTALPYVTVQFWCEIYGDCTVTPVAFRIGDRTVDPHYDGSPDFTFAVENWLEFAEQTDRYGIARITASVDVIYSDANQTRQETQTASSEINIANYLAQLPAHTEHQWQKQITGTRYINENKRQHLRLEDYTFICACGEQGESGTDTTPEAHVFSNIGHVEKEHQARGTRPLPGAYAARRNIPGM